MAFFPHLQILMKAPSPSTLQKNLMKVKHDRVAPPDHVTMPTPFEIPEQVKSYYASPALDILSFVYQTDSRMEFLVGLDILHRDLASRNILTTIGKYWKLEDFGPSQETKDLYVTQCFSNLPFR